ENRTDRHARGSGSVRRLRDRGRRGRLSTGRARPRRHGVLPHGRPDPARAPRHAAGAPARRPAQGAGDALAHQPVGPAPRRAPRRRRDRLQRRQRPPAAGPAGGRRADRGARRRAGVAAQQVGADRSPLLPGLRAAGGPLGRRAHRRRPRDPGALPGGARGGQHLHPVRRPGAGAPGAAPAGRAGPRAGGLPPRGGPLRAGEPRPRGRRRPSAQHRHAAARRRRRRAVRAGLHRRHPASGRGRRAGAARRPGLGPGAARRAVRRVADVRARAQRRRHEPVPAARHGRVRSGARLRRRLQPRGAGGRGGVLARRRHAGRAAGRGGGRAGAGPRARPAGMRPGGSRLHVGRRGRAVRAAVPRAAHLRAAAAPGRAREHRPQHL
ncbi:MAG: Alpha-D-GlcNAc alpha-1,2-L-rhamnosyltransferase, partial [uncultured Frankineae bacterium]